MRNVYNSAKKLYEASLTEEHVIRAIVQGLSVNRAKVHRIVERIPWGKKTSTPGIPDLVGWWPNKHEATRPEWYTVEAGRVFFIEVKKPGGQRRPAQIAWIEEAKRDGMIAFFAESWNDVVAEFARHGIKLAGG